MSVHSQKTHKSSKGEQKLRHEESRSRPEDNHKREASKSRTSRSRSKSKNGKDNFEKLWAELQKKNHELEELFRENRELKVELESAKKGKHKYDEEIDGLRDKLRSMEKHKEDGNKSKIKVNESTDDLLMRITLLGFIVTWGDYDAKLKKFEIQRLNEELSNDSE